MPFTDAAKRSSFENAGKPGYQGSGTPVSFTAATSAPWPDAPASEIAVETEIVAKGKTAPRVTPEAIEALIMTECYAEGGDVGVWTTPTQPDLAQMCWAALNRLTICVLVLQGGFTVVGQSSCVSSENFDAELGRKLAREDARRQIWALEGYALRKQLAQT